MFTGMTKVKKLELAQQLHKEAVDRDRRWQREAREDFAFRDGYQWSQEEKQILEQELRPVLTMNLTKASCDLIMGMNEDNRIIYQCSPAEPGDAFLSEVLNDITRWVTDRFDFEEEEDGAFESSTICGRGFVGVDFLPDPERFGEILLQELNIPVNEVHFDPASRRPKLEDASYIVWERWLTRHDFQMRYPKVSRTQVDKLVEEAGSSNGQGNLAAGDSAEHAFDKPHDTDHDLDSDYDQYLDLDWYDKNQNMIKVVQMEYWEMFKRYFVWNPGEKGEGNGKFEEIDHNPTKEEKIKFLEIFEEEMTVEEMTDKKVKWMIFSGDKILYDSDSPMPFKGFSIVPTFAYRDISQRTSNHFGVVRLMKDPQKEVNKRWSQTLNMLNQQVQTGIYAETDAFVDKRQAEQSMKEPGSITWVNNGAIAGGKFKEREIPKFPNAPMQMEQYSQEIIKKITGINPDLLGQDRGRQEPGVVVKMRQQQGMTLLKPLFNNYNKMKKELYKRILGIIMAFMPDDQILRILGQNDRYEVDKKTGVIVDKATGMQADLRDVRDLEYNIVAEQAPGNMSKRMLELSALLEMSQQLPVPPEQIIEKMDLPASEKAKWLEYVNEQMKGQTDQQEKEIQTDADEFDRKQTATEEKDMMSFVLGVGKLNQMAEKDEKSLKKDFEAMDIEEQNNIMTMTSNMLKIATDAQKAKMDSRKGETSGGTKQATN